MTLTSADLDLVYHSDPQCGMEYILEQDVTKLRLQVKKQIPGCSYTFRVILLLIIYF